MRFLFSSVCLAAALVCAAPRAADADVADLFARAAAWWHARGVASSEVPIHDSQFTIHESDEGKKPADGGKPGEAPNRAPGMCVVPREPPKAVCEAGSGFLCVDAPPGGVAGESVVLRGTIDRKGSVLASIRIAVQNEYTKRSAFVDTADPQGQDCRGDLPSGAAFCLDGQGYFAARVPLAEKGPHTVSVSATRLSGEPLERRVRTSRVVALSLEGEDLSFDPDVRAAPSVDVPAVTATLDLLGGCQFCDFIGASTGGVRVTVENVIREPSGAIRRISCPTTVEQGGQGRFVVGVPVGAGTNTITVTACNAAVEGRCPSVGGVSFEAKGDASALEIASPPPAPAYDAASYPTIDWKFSLGGGAACVDLQFNREPPREICPDAAGQFTAALSPRVGVNVATLAREGGQEEFAWTFGWGAIRSPHDHAGRIDVPDAVRVALPARTVNRILLPILNNVLNADELDALIEEFFAAGPAAAPKGEGAPPTPVAIPKCQAGGGLGGFAIALRGKPRLEGATIEDAVFENDRVGLRVIFKGLRIGLDLAPDEDGDKRPDRDPLPLVIAFKKAIAEAAVEAGKDEGGRPLLLITSPNDDCSFKDDSYCTGMPAVLIPKNFVGGANAWGGFIECDEGRASSEARDACRAVNSLNAQTGVLSEKILDAINGAVYCGGSAAITRAAREGIRMEGVALGCAEGEECEGTIGRLLPPVSLPISLVLGDGVGISSSGVLVSADVAVGSPSLYDRTPAPFKIPEAGLIAGEEVGAAPFSSASGVEGDVALALSLDSANALLFAATVQGDGRNQRGLLDFDIDEDFFTDLGFNFVEQCDKFVPVPGEKEAPPTICYVRPRVNELLGSPLTTYGYFPANQPLLLALRANRALAPRLSVRTLEELPVVPRATEEGDKEEGDAEEAPPAGNLFELELGGAAISFYALEIDPTKSVDEFGNPQLRRDERGRPIIHSMRPEDPDPWNGQIASFDLTLLLAIEIDGPSPDPEDPDASSVAIRLLSGRSRLIIVPVAGTNATTVPAMGLVSALSEKLKLAIAGMGSEEKPIRIAVPREVALGGSDEGSLFGILGLKTISFGPDGIRLSADPATNSVALALQTVITQVLHEGGKEVVHTISSR